MATTYFVRASGGSDGNPGTTFALAFATISHAMSVATTGGDTVLVCSDGTHFPTASISPGSGVVGVYNNPIYLRGAGPTGADDGSIATISGSLLSASVNVFTIYPNSMREISGLRVENSNNGHGFYIPSSTSPGSLTFKNVFCTGHNIGFYNATISNGQHDFVFIGCEAFNNTSGIVTGEQGYYKNCNVHHNSSYGFYVVKQTQYWVGTHITGCNVYANGSYGIRCSTSAGYFWGAQFTNNVVYNNTLAGLYMAGTGPIGRIVCFSNIFKNNGTYGISVPTGTFGTFSFCDYNCYHQNTSGPVDFNGGIPPGANNISSDPLFTSETPSFEDFTLQVGSPCRNVGYGYNG